jgi:hypothetical protein
MRCCAVKVLRWLASFAVGVVPHYALYRMALPIEPFIYMAFSPTGNQPPPPALAGV